VTISKKFKTLLNLNWSKQAASMHVTSGDFVSVIKKDSSGYDTP